MSKRRLPLSLRRLIIARAGGRCEYCRSPEDFASASFEVEHILPSSLLGPDDESNLAFACGSCNSFKATRTAALDPVTGRTVALFNPRTDIWEEHFAWDLAGHMILGQTPCGRATVICLRMNRLSLQNLRRALIAVGEHPRR